MHLTPECARPLTKFNRSLSRWIGIGAAVGLVVTGGLSPLTSMKVATDTSFALGVLLFGFGLATWAGTVGFSESLTAVQARFSSNSEWTQAGAQRAFAVLTWIGVGWSMTAVISSILFVGI